MAPTALKSRVSTSVSFTMKQFQYIMRDDVLHAAFGIRVVRELTREKNLRFDSQAIADLRGIAANYFERSFA
jgi:ribonucleotide reductase beta subunit family protein with ferritin-like domain